MADSFQNEVPAARVNIKLDLHTGNAKKKVELPLKLLAVGDYSNGKEHVRCPNGTRLISIKTTSTASWLSFRLRLI